MKAFILNAFTPVIFIFMFHLPLFSQPRNQVFIGARPLGLGGTYVAFADDGNTAYWNPAGLPKLNRLEFNSMYANLYNIQGLKNVFLSLCYPLTPRYAVGASWHHLGFDDNELAYFRNKAGFSIGGRLLTHLFLGANLKYLTTDTRFESISEGKASGYGMDWGVLYSFPVQQYKWIERINAGFMFHDFTGTRVNYAGTGRSEEILPPNFRYGFAVYLPQTVSLRWFSLQAPRIGFDFDDRFHLGVESWLFDVLGLRFGLQKDFHTAERATYSFGVSIKFPYMDSQMDYAFVTPPTLASTNIYSFSLSKRLAPLKILNEQLDDLFVSFYKIYRSRNVGWVEVRNDTDQPIETRLRVSVPGLTMDTPGEKFMLEPYEKRKLHFSFFFLDHILDFRKTETWTAEIEIDYYLDQKVQSIQETVEFQLFGRGALTWESPAKAAAFISKQDQMVDLFARQAEMFCTDCSETQLGPLNVAMSLFSAVNRVGIRFQPDAESPFSQIPKNQHYIDHLHYPAELFSRKFGDCDDLTVLLAALLENANISTALISTEKEMWLMFDSGIHVRNIGVLPLPDSLAIEINNSWWIPLDPVKLDTSFSAAWVTGSRKFSAAENQPDFKIVFVRDVAGSYPSVTLPEFQQQVPPLPAADSMKAKMKRERKWLKQQRESAIYNQYIVELQKHPNNNNLRNRLGIIYAFHDSLTDAKAQFQECLERTPADTLAAINLANLHFLSGHFWQAESLYLSASDSGKADPGVALNLALLYQTQLMQGAADSSRLLAASDSFLTIAFRHLQGDEKRALNLLGISPSDFVARGISACCGSIMYSSQYRAILRFIQESAKAYLLFRRVRGLYLTPIPDQPVLRKEFLYWAFKKLNS